MVPGSNPGGPTNFLPMSQVAHLSTPLAVSQCAWKSLAVTALAAYIVIYVSRFRSQPACHLRVLYVLSTGAPWRRREADSLEI